LVVEEDGLEEGEEEEGSVVVSVVVVVESVESATSVRRLESMIQRKSVKLHRHLNIISFQLFFLIG
jgi:hypothetical protein